jgi:hypothetical protein
MRYVFIIVGWVRIVRVHAYVAGPSCCEDL